MFAALYIPDFAAAAALRGRPEWNGLPCAVLAPAHGEHPKGNLPLAALNAAARFAGIASGWPLNRALVRCPDLRVLPRDPAAEARLLADLVECAQALTPDLEITAADGLILDLSSSRPASAHAAALSALKLPGVELLWHAQAATPDLAFLAARHQSTQGRSLHPQDLASLPLAVLQSLATANPPKNEALALLEMWGLLTLGEFLALPRQALTDRLGPAVARWHDLLLGKSCRLLRLHQPPESLAQRLDFEAPLSSLEPLAFGLKRLLHTLAGRLAARHLAAGELVLSLWLEGGGGRVVGRRFRLPEPQIRVEAMLAPLQSWLDSLRLDGLVGAVELEVEATHATAAQRQWFGRELPQPQRWAETLAKLEALLGPGRVGVPVPGASHAPDAFSLRPASDAPLAGAAAEAGAGRPGAAVPLHRYRPPRQIAVAHEIRGRHPRPLALLSGPYPGAISDLRGPFPASGAWWDPAQAWQRLEWDIQVAGGNLLRLVYQNPDRWQLDGIYQ